MSKMYIGIDPGSKGYLCAMGEGTTDYQSIADSNYNELASWLREKSKDNEVVVCMEEVHAIYGSSAKATFSFGEIFGLLQGLIIALGMKYVLIQPKDWQKEMWINSDKVMEGKKVDTKKTSANAGLRLFPATDFRRTDKCKKIDDNKVDATLICEYARRKNL